MTLDDVDVMLDHACDLLDRPATRDEGVAVVLAVCRALSMRRDDAEPATAEEPAADSDELTAARERGQAVTRRLLDDAHMLLADEQHAEAYGLLSALRMMLDAVKPADTPEERRPDHLDEEPDFIERLRDRDGESA